MQKCPVIKGTDPWPTLALGLSWDSQVRCWSEKYITVSVNTPSVSSLRKYSTSKLTGVQNFGASFLNPRTAGVWLVTRPAGGGAKGPPEISQTTEPISKLQTPFDCPVRELPVQGEKFHVKVTDDVTGQVKVKMLDFSGLVTSASKISMLSANRANESSWIVSLTSVSIISCALWP